MDPWFLGAVALALAAGGLAALRGAPVAGALLALLLAGWAGQLRLTEPGFFFYLRLSPDGALDLLAAALVAAQLAVPALLLARWGLLRGPALRRVGMLRLALAAGAAALLATPLNAFLWRGDLPGYAVHLVAALPATLGGLAALAALAAAPDLGALGPREGGVERLSRLAGRVLPVLAFAGAAAIALGAFGGAPLVDDETAYLFQARTFAAGRLMAGPLPAGAAPAFDLYLIEARPDGWLAVTAPGWPAVLALGVLLGVPLLVNPLLGGAAVALGHRLAARWAGPGPAALVALLMATSPMLLLLSGSLMTHALALALVLAAWALATAAQDRAREGRPGALGLAFAAGLAMGWLFVTRSLEGLLLGTLTGVWLLARLGLRRPGPTLAYALGCVLAGSALFAYNLALTGSLLSSPQGEYLARVWGPGANAYGFGPAIGPPGGWGALDLWPGHGPLEALANTATSLAYLNLELLGWPQGAAALAVAALLWGRVRGPVAAMAAVAAAVIGAHALYWFAANFYAGPRYWYAAHLAFVGLVAAGVGAVAARTGAPGAVRRLAVAAALATAFGPAFATWRVVGRVVPGVAATHAILREARAEAEARGPDFVALLACSQALEAALILDDPLLRPGRPVYALSRGPEADAALAAALGRRPVTITAGCPPAGA